MHWAAERGSLMVCVNGTVCNMLLAILKVSSCPSASSGAQRCATGRQRGWRHLLMPSSGGWQVAGGQSCQRRVSLRCTSAVLQDDGPEGLPVAEVL